MVFTAFYCYKKELYEYIKIIGFYLGSIIILITFFILIEIIVFSFLEFTLIIMFELEMASILMLFSWDYYIIYKRSEGKTFFIYLAIILIFSHILLSGLFLPFVPGTIIIMFIALLTIISTINMNEYRKRLYLLFIGAWFLYLSHYLLNEVIFAISSILIIWPIISLGYRPITARIIHFYHSLRTEINQILKRHEINMKVNKKGHFFMTKVIISQIGREEETKKKRFQTWLLDFYRKRKTSLAKIVLNKDKFKFYFLIKTRTEREGIEKGNLLLTNLKSTYKGLDGRLEHIKVDNKYLYKKEKWWVIKFPKAPYSNRIDLINRLITLFGEDRHKIKLLIMWKKAPPKKILEQRAKIIALKYKDAAEKNTYLQMWRDELFKVKIYISYGIAGNEFHSKSHEVQALNGRIRSLLVSIRNEKKIGKIRRVLCGARADFLRGNLYSGRYLTPISFDFTFTKQMPFHVPVGLKKQVIKWDSHVKNNSNFPIGKWIDEYGRKRENLMHVKVDDFVQGGCVIGQIGAGKSFLIGHLINSISRTKPETGILIINFKREHEENIYSAERFYKFGKNFQLPYLHALQNRAKFEKHIVQVSKAIMGAIGFEEEAVYACKSVLEEYIIENNEPPRSIVNLLQLVRDYFYEEEHDYDDKFRSRITSALNTRINTQLSSKTLIETLDPFVDTGQWYEDWKNGKVVQIDLTECNEWEQRLISIIILQTIRTLTPDKGVHGLKYMIVIDEAHRILKSLPTQGKNKSDDYVACEQIIKIFEILFSEFRDRGISFLIANQRADNLDESAIALPSLKFLMRQSSASVERFTKNPMNIETIVRLPDRFCVLDRGVSGEFFNFITADYYPKKIEIDNATNILKIQCPKCLQLIKNTNNNCPSCGSSIIIP
ncbi:MAG: hypothetical protein ACFFAT_12725 [Promethearchaeota archaeon]